MNETRRMVIWAGALLLLIAAAAWYWLGERQTHSTPGLESVVGEQTEAPAPSSAAGESPPDHHPMPTAAEVSTPLPALNESDAPFTAALGNLTDASQLAALLVNEQLIRRLVVTVDNLPRERLATNDRAFKKTPGEFLVKSRDGLYSSSPSNEARYVPLVSLVNLVGADRAAALYLRFYPLFDKAYRELGYPERNFNDRLVQVIDHLLATPVIEGPIELVQPRVFYQFADPALESRSAGQKILLRMGSVNAAQLKAWLQQFRAEIIAAS